MYLPYFAIGVYPSMNPSGVQLRRCAIHGYARHSNSAVLVNHLCCLQVPTYEFDLLLHKHEVRHAPIKINLKPIKPT